MFLRDLGIALTSIAFIVGVRICALKYFIKEFTCVGKEENGHTGLV